MIIEILIATMLIAVSSIVIIRSFKRKSKTSCGCSSCSSDCSSCNLAKKENAV